jgi:hypothetical protein
VPLDLREKVRFVLGILFVLPNNNSLIGKEVNVWANRNSSIVGLCEITVYAGSQMRPLQP